MDEQVSRFVGAYVRLVGLSFLTAGVLGLGGVLLVGQLPGGYDATDVLGGVTVSLIAGLVGALPIGWTAAGQPEKMPQAVLLSTGLRFLVVLFLAAVVLLSGWFDRVVAATAIAVSYLAMLIVDTVFAVRLVGAARRENP